MRNTLLLVMLLFAARAAAQSSIILGLVPNTGNPGQALSVEIKGLAFPQSLSAANVTFGADIAVSSVQRQPDQIVIINDAEVTVNVIRVQISISSSASSGSRSVRVGGISSFSAAVFNVIDPSEPVAAGEILSFIQSGSYKASVGPQEAAAHDFTGDGILDLALGVPGSNSLLLFTGRPGGRFAGPKRIRNDISGVWLIEIADVNSDGKADLITGDKNASNVDVWLNSGGLNFRKPQHTPIDASPWGIGIGDFNGDGKVDALVAVRDTDHAGVMLGRGDGSFQTSSLPAGFTPLAAAVCDFNHDAFDDGVVANFGNGISLYEGSSRGLTSLGRKAAPVALQNVVCGDFNADGFNEIAGIGGDSIVLYRNLKNGKFGTPPKRIRMAPFVWNLTAADFNNDGKTDLALVNQASGYLSVMAGLGNMNFSQPVTYKAGSQPETLLSADFNNDSLTDILVSNAASDSVTVFLNSTTAANSIHD